MEPLKQPQSSDTLGYKNDNFVTPQQLLWPKLDNNKPVVTPQNPVTTDIDSKIDGNSNVQQPPKADIPSINIFGRDEELKAIYTILLSHKPNILLSGPNQIGKKSLVKS